MNILNLKVSAIHRNLTVAFVFFISACGPSPNSNNAYTPTPSSSSTPPHTFAEDCSILSDEVVVNKIYARFAINTELRQRMMSVNISARDDTSSDPKKKEITILGWASTDPTNHPGMKAKFEAAINDVCTASSIKPLVDGKFAERKTDTTNSTEKPTQQANGCNGLELCDGMCVPQGTCATSVDH